MNAAATPMARSKVVTSPYAPDLDQVRAWAERMIKAMKFVELVTAIIALVARMRDINTGLGKRLAHLQRKRPKSERLVALQRQLALPLLGLASPVATPTAATSPASKQDSKPRRRGKSGGRGGFPAHLRRLDVPNPVPAEQRICPVCGEQMKTVGHSACETITVIPAQVVVERRLDETVACPNDDTIVSAAPPSAIVERGKLGDTLVIEATCDKYIEHQPAERQCVRFARAGVEIAPQTLRRAIAAHIDLLEPIARLIAEICRGNGYLGTDATGIPVLDRDAPDGIRIGTMWCWTNARWVSFFYSPNGNSQDVRDFLDNDLCRTVQCDGTSITNCIERAGGKRPGCMSHGRRRFVESARGGDLLALEALRIIAPLFEVERVSKLAGDTAEQRLARRVQYSKPHVDELRAWIDEHRPQIPPKTPLGRALGYLDRQWKRLTMFLEDGNIELTNNRRERELRRLVLGRKNWLFTWLDAGGHRTASILSIIATCIAHDVNPRAYLHRVTKLIVAGWPNAQLRELLPDRILAAHPDLFVGEPDPLPADDAPLLPPATPI